MSTAKGKCLTCYDSGELVTEFGPAVCPDCAGEPGAVSPWEQTERRLRDIELNCIDGTIAEINLGQLGATACHDKCEVSMVAAGMTSGCWILAGDMNCYCRSGVLNPGSTFVGGTCN